MLPKEVIFLPGAKHRRKSALLGRSQCAVVEKRFLLEGTRPPPIHTRRRDCNPVHAAGLVGNESADVFETQAAEHLESSGDVSIALKAIATRVIMIFAEECSCNAKIGICPEAVQQKFDIIGRKRHVGVETTDNIVFQPCNAGVTRLETRPPRFPSTTRPPRAQDV